MGQTHVDYYETGYSSQIDPQVFGNYRTFAGAKQGLKDSGWKVDGMKKSTTSDYWYSRHDSFYIRLKTLTIKED